MNLKVFPVFTKYESSEIWSDKFILLNISMYSHS